MASKLVALTATLIVNIIAAIIILFGMLIAMNGFSESDATWGLAAFVLLALLVTLVTSIGAFFLAGILIKRNFSPVTSALIAVPVFSIVGIGLEIVCSLIGVGVAEFVRVNY
ncbi:MAG: hypothetical protein KA746_01615 [Pyrinomonadaceae bacterium]|nr:hypothetical protein [Pyrinomonadaceae bacterium]MBP6211636.1 hypothetical protein [Pyrinomonadaceae bacterium]